MGSTALAADDTTDGAVIALDGVMVETAGQQARMVLDRTGQPEQKMEGS